MKKYLLLILLILPISVFAKNTCDSNNIRIQSITLEDTRGNIEEVSAPSSDDGKIHLDLKMNVVGDSAEYKIVLKNTSDEEYYFDEKSLNLDTSYVDYEVQYEDGSNLIKSGEDKIITLKVVYKDKVASSNLENGLYSDNQVLKLYLSDKSIINDLIDNPITSRNYIFIIIIGLIIGFIIINKKYRKSSYLLLVFLIIPFTVKALCRHTLEIETNLVIDGKEAIFLPGQEVNVKMKHLAGDDTSSVNIEYNFKDKLITSIRYSDVEPDEINREEKNIVSTSESVYPIYMWYEDGTIYWWSEDKTPALNEDASYMFYLLSVLSDISGLNTFDSFYTTSMSSLFSYSGVTSLSYLSNWNTSNVTLMNNVFGGSRNLPMHINSLVDLSKWDTSNVINMSDIFRCNIQLESLNGLENWNTAKVTDMSHMFDYNLNLNDIFSIKDWNTSSVISFSSMFQHTYNLEKIDVGNWNTSHVQYMQYMFSNGFSSMISNLKEIKGIEKWNTSNVTNMCAMFNHQVGLEKLDLSGWDTSNVTDMSYMFSETNLKTIYVSENFTTVNVASSGSMFSRRPSAGVISTPTLIGGNGTIWNENFIDKAYARIDTDDYPGYFTLK